MEPFDQVQAKSLMDAVKIESTFTNSEKISESQVNLFSVFREPVNIFKTDDKITEYLSIKKDMLERAILILGPPGTLIAKRVADWIASNGDWTVSDVSDDNHSHDRLIHVLTDQFQNLLKNRKEHSLVVLILDTKNNGFITESAINDSGLDEDTYLSRLTEYRETVNETVDEIIKNEKEKKNLLSVYRVDAQNWEEELTMLKVDKPLIYVLLTPGGCEITDWVAAHFCQMGGDFLISYIDALKLEAPPRAFIQEAVLEDQSNYYLENCDIRCALSSDTWKLLLKSICNGRNGHEDAYIISNFPFSIKESKTCVRKQIWALAEVARIGGIIELVSDSGCIDTDILKFLNFFLIKDGHHIKVPLEEGMLPEKLYEHFKPIFK
eukprot:GHVL01000122.1.p2 GENE.GHVL01000122.1~~GHVL01000122.1.p2  ORF type:complete len:411 (-),score=126.37 GHVL01000122.1:1697-2836(-)